MAEMGIESLKANLTNPARTFLWEVRIPAAIGGGDLTTLMLRCQTSSIPERAFEEILVPFKQTAGIKYHGRATYPHTWELNFVESEDKKTFQSFYNWCQKQIHDVDGVGDADIAIKTDMYLALLNTKGEDTLQIKLVGCYIQTMGAVALDYAGNEVVRFAITISYDRWEQRT